MGAPPKNQNAAKTEGTGSDANTHIRHPQAERSAWLSAAKKRRLSLTALIRKAVNQSIGRTG